VAPQKWGEEKRSGKQRADGRRMTTWACTVVDNLQMNGVGWMSDERANFRRGQPGATRREKRTLAQWEKNEFGTKGCWEGSVRKDQQLRQGRITGGGSRKHSPKSPAKPPQIHKGTGNSKKLPKKCHRRGRSLTRERGQTSGGGGAPRKKKNHYGQQHLGGGVNQRKTERPQWERGKGKKKGGAVERPGRAT